MRKIVIFLLLATTIISCAPLNYVPLKGNYKKGPVVITSDKTKDQVWDNIVDLFAQKGISIRIIDRSSGLIITNERTALKVTYEKKDNTLKDTTAYLVAKKLQKKGSATYYPALKATGEWNIRIKEQDGKTLINVNLLNIKLLYQQPVKPVTYANTDSEYIDGGSLAQSLQNFEMMVANAVK